MVRFEEAKILLGFSPDATPSPSQVKAAYRRKAWETHPDRFPPHQKPQAEHNFKSISEAYTFLSSGRRSPTSWVVRTGVRTKADGVRRNSRVASLPFLVIILSAFALGGSTASRAYQRQQEAQPSCNPFLP